VAIVPRVVAVPIEGEGHISWRRAGEPMARPASTPQITRRTGEIPSYSAMRIASKVGDSLLEHLRKRKGDGCSRELQLPDGNVDLTCAMIAQVVYVGAAIVYRDGHGHPTDTPSEGAIRVDGPCRR